jgi:hypothetical protein
MKSLYEKLNINKDTKVKRPDLYSFYEDSKDVREGDKVLFACKCGTGSGIFVRCIVDKITYAKHNGQLTDLIFKVNLKLENDELNYIKEDNIIKECIEDGVPGYAIKRQLLKIED